eukprot:g3635.t1
MRLALETHVKTGMKLDALARKFNVVPSSLRNQIFEPPENLGTLSSKKRLQLAVEWFQEHNESDKISYGLVAKKFNVSQVTLQHRLLTLDPLSRAERLQLAVEFYLVHKEEEAVTYSSVARKFNVLTDTLRYGYLRLDPRVNKTTLSREERIQLAIAESRKNSRMRVDALAKSFNVLRIVLRDRLLMLKKKTKSKTTKDEEGDSEGLGTLSPDEKMLRAVESFLEHKEFTKLSYSAVARKFHIQPETFRLRILRLDPKVTKKILSREERLKLAVESHEKTGLRPSALARRFNVLVTSLSDRLFKHEETETKNVTTALDDSSLTTCNNSVVKEIGKVQYDESNDSGHSTNDESAESSCVGGNDSDDESDREDDDAYPFTDDAHPFVRPQGQIGGLEYDLLALGEVAREERYRMTDDEPVTAPWIEKNDAIELRRRGDKVCRVQEDPKQYLFAPRDAHVAAVSMVALASSEERQKSLRNAVRRTKRSNESGEERRKRKKLVTASSSENIAGFTVKPRMSSPLIDNEAAVYPPHSAPRTSRSIDTSRQYVKMWTYPM